ncbi:MAG: accessory Sec system protein translocase subunit SecY2 [Leuconostoc gelidum]|jgi:preprotein translocase subunit SecY|uniref:accessory Sec system protein translocase subunit SecY2 n=1 Tax=Leuconostoc gelidum TaxID=1244 RepID=UPI0015770DD0|nr:accessory Sec system protein translocase subunit SecY2 [Leuconostoc gelidum]MBZ5979107.1 accessory Sec system protein translocase subunit SecY2 [Leuconostoc gelidum subsp. gelidum]MBZ6001957.1 accessory Sec system protein translocase subunit SecY2 [Leuconostoc gelidum subsp. gelidum]QDJ30374.1 accessory Sec system protein translocase subunit SecY2 [Leuconostoc gelidum subsp. gelidum]
MKELTKRILYSMVIIIAYEIGTHIILPGHLIRAYQSTDFMKSVSLVIGGDLSKMSFFSLGLAPYMSGMIFWRVIQSLNKDRFSKISENRIYYFRTVLILFIAIIQSLGLAVSIKANVDFVNNNIFNITVATIVFTTGSMFTMWLVEMNMQSGIGGPSLLILVGILVRLPKFVWSFLKENLLDYPTIESVVTFFVSVTGVILIVGIISFILGSELRIPVRRIMIRNDLAAPTYIPIKLLPANAMPYMFGMTFLMIPQLIFPFLSNILPFIKKDTISDLTSLSTWYGICLYLIILIILGYGFAFVNVNPSEISEDLRKSGDYIVDILPGYDTREYVTHKLMDMASIGNLATMILLGVPLMLSLNWPQLSSFSYLFGSLLILNTTIVTIIDQCRALVEKERYPSILPKEN